MELLPWPFGTFEACPVQPAPREQGSPSPASSGRSSCTVPLPVSTSSTRQGTYPRYDLLLLNGGSGRYLPVPTGTHLVKKITALFSLPGTYQLHLLRNLFVHYSQTRSPSLNVIHAPSPPPDPGLEFFRPILPLS